MSRSALVVAVGLFALGALAWWLGTGGDREPPAPPSPAALAPPPSATRLPEPPGLPAGAARATPVAPAGAPVRITTSEEFVRALDARGLDGARALAAYREWRVGRGYLGPDPLAGVPAEAAPEQVYAVMDRPTQLALADSGDLGATQAYAAGSLPADPVTAVEYYGKAASRGSAAAMLEVATVLAGIGDQQPGGPGNDPTFARRLLALRGGDPLRNLRLDAMAWTLAAIRQHGPAVATPSALALTADLGRNPDKDIVAAVCGRSLAILADLRASASGQQDPDALPPAFLAERDLYERLPCRDTPAPVMPPRALAGCSASPALADGDRPVELWVCAAD